MLKRHDHDSHRMAEAQGFEFVYWIRGKWNICILFQCI